jgi:hypothetical protein
MVVVNSEEVIELAEHLVEDEASTERNCCWMLFVWEHEFQFDDNLGGRSTGSVYVEGAGVASSYSDIIVVSLGCWGFD